MIRKQNLFSWQGKMSLVLISLFTITSIVYVVGGFDLHREPSDVVLQAPSMEHLLGTDELGIDILAQIIFGTCISLCVGVSVGILSGVGGSILGMWAGYRGGWIDRLIMSISDIILCIPNMILIIVISAFFGANLFYIILTISILSWVGPARISRSKMLSMRNEKYITAAKSYGATFPHLFIRHFLPSLYPIICMSFIRMISHGMITEASLSFIGIGDPTLGSWGGMINQAIHFPGIYLTNYWKWMILPPVFCFVVFIVCISFVGRDFEKIFNEKAMGRLV